ncbi:copper amine oxidase N-terminal domain-containing protein [Peribacillus saganii]|uniref:Copper amine oxidase N-terminal domain-containing protein n=1 Tax=Peribacillus saganii TaxID=2303992 RepID=A0A372LPH1_9BACI|nr:stalk domain-containing protein [Peribacillus saganii]RFU69252.1 copper amine oxidase N-terminal domain-containing protein [Peribacillus saganii]
MKKVLMLVLIVFLLQTGMNVKAATHYANIKVNGVAMTAPVNQPFNSGGITYVPLNVIVQKMGDKVTWLNAEKKSVIQLKNKQVINVKDGATYVGLNGKTTPLVTKIVKGKTVDAKLKPIFKNNTLYVPVQFLSSKIMGYSVKIVTEKGKRAIHVNKLKPQPKSKPAPKSDPYKELPKNEQIPVTGDMSKAPISDGKTAPVSKEFANQ